MLENNTIWNLTSFDELGTQQLYQILALRTQVFVVEQDCVYQDMDNHDQQAWHLCGMRDNDLLAYLRLLSPGIKYSEPAIGRVVIRDSERGTGMGYRLMEEGMTAASRLFPGQGVRLSAQSHLEKFYRSFGFQPVGNEYLEDNIPHIEMFTK